MNARLTPALICLVMAMGLVASGCVVEPARVRMGGEFVLTAPPTALVEVRGAAPGPGYLWIDGYWNWVGVRHVWVPGRWAPGRRGYVWVPHQWVHAERGWRMREGHWERARR